LYCSSPEFVKSLCVVHRPAPNNRFAASTPSDTRRSADSSPNATAHTYVNRLTDAGVITPALIDAVQRERGEVTHRLMAADLDISPLAAGIILQALWPVVQEYYDIETAGPSLCNERP